MTEEQENFIATQFITFSVHGQDYGIDIMSVKEIKGWVPTTSLPNTPRFIRGVINLRGTVVPILDVKERFGLGTTEPTKNHVVMLVTVGDRILGILVDAVSDILTIEPKDIKTPPTSSAGEDSPVIGVVNLDEKMVGLLSLEKLCSHS